MSNKLWLHPGADPNRLISDLKDRVKELESERASHAREIELLRDKAQAFLDAVDRSERSEAMRGLYQMAALRGRQYDGPRWEEEFNALRAFLAAMEENS